MSHYEEQREEFWEMAAIPVREELPPVSPITGQNLPSGKDGSPYYDITLPCGTVVSCNDVIDALDMNFNTGEAFKALWRKGRKHSVPASYDLDKVVYFATRERDRVNV